VDSFDLLVHHHSHPAQVLDSSVRCARVAVPLRGVVSTPYDAASFRIRATKRSELCRGASRRRVVPRRFVNRANVFV